MRKALSLLLALVMCLSMCACSEKKEESKYVGTYTYNLESRFVNYQIQVLETTYSFVINSDGTGHLNIKAANEISGSNPDPYNFYFIYEGDTLLEYDLQWKEVDGYLVVEGVGKRYYTPLNDDHGIIDYDKKGTPITLSETYELRGNQLICIKNEIAEYTKVS